MYGAADSTAIFVALIGGITTITTGALALLGVFITTRNQARDRLLAELQEKVEHLEAQEGADP